jgi:hypothetical protein
MLGKPARGSAPLRGCSRKGLTPSSLRAWALQAGMAETAIRRSPKKMQGREALMEGLANSDYDKTTNKSQKKSEAILNGRHLLVLTFWL